MLSLHIAAVGRLKSGPEFDLLKDYQTRLGVSGRSLGFDRLHLSEVEAPKSLEGKARQNREAELLVDSLPDNARIFIMDERGKSMKSMKLAEQLESIRDESIGNAIFVIGGADGHGDAVKALLSDGRATALSFGVNTWPHMLLRVMLAEQLYRAVSILSGHPYHRE